MEAIGTVTLADDGCEYVGSAEAAAGSVSLNLVNETSGQFDVHLWLMDDGHAYDELAAHIADEQRRLTAGEAPLGHPDFATLVAEESVAGESRGQLKTDVREGVYGMACILFPEPGVLGGIWAVGPLAVGSEA